MKTANLCKSVDVMHVLMFDTSIVHHVLGERFFDGFIKHRWFVHVVPYTSQRWSGIREIFVGIQARDVSRSVRVEEIDVAAKTRPAVAYKTPFIRLLLPQNASITFKDSSIGITNKITVGQSPIVNEIALFNFDVWIYDGDQSPVGCR